MSRGRPDSLRDAALAGAVGLAAALAVGLSLGALAKAPGFAGRLSTVEDGAARAQSLIRTAGREAPAPQGALCRGTAAEAARRLREAITTRASQVGLSADTLDVSPADAGGTALSPLSIRFSMTGSYEGALALLAGLSRERPEVFADSVDLTPKVSNVTLAFSGRAFCAV